MAWIQRQKRPGQTGRHRDRVSRRNREGLTARRRREMTRHIYRYRRSRRVQTDRGPRCRLRRFLAVIRCADAGRKQTQR